MKIISKIIGKLFRNSEKNCSDRFNFEKGFESTRVTKGIDSRETSINKPDITSEDGENGEEDFERCEICGKIFTGENPGRQKGGHKGSAH